MTYGDFQPCGPSPADVRRQLDRMLNAPAWSGTRRRSSMLRFIVEETLAGRSHRVSGVAVAVDVFGRAGDFDPQHDAVVRVEARRLRRDLDSYYAGPGRDDPLVISVPKGRYVPHFAWREPPPTPPTPPAAASVATPPEPRRTLRRAWVGLAGAAIAATSVFLWRVEAEPPAPPLRGPAVLVRPFEALDGTERMESLAVGLTHELITELMRFPSFRVYAPRDSLYPAKAAQRAEILESHPARYLVEGHIRTAGDRLRIGARLVDAVTGEVVWSDTLTRPLAVRDLLDGQAEIAADIASAIGQPYGHLHEAVAARLASSADPRLASYRCVLSAYRYRHTYDVDLYGPARRCLEAAVRRDPDYAQAWAMLAYLRLDAVRMNYEPDQRLEPALAAAHRAQALEPDNPEVLKALSLVQYYAGDAAAAVATARRALERNPHDPDALGQLGWRLTMRGHFDEGERYLRRAVERSVSPPPWYFIQLAVIACIRGDYEAMLTAAERAAEDGSAVSQSLLAIAYGYLGRQEEAAAALERMAELWPLLARDPRAAYGQYQAHPDIVETLVDGLENAGSLSRRARERAD